MVSATLKLHSSTVDFCIDVIESVESVRYRCAGAYARYGLPYFCCLYVYGHTKGVQKCLVLLRSKLQVALTFWYIYFIINLDK